MLMLMIMLVLLLLLLLLLLSLMVEKSLLLELVDVLVKGQTRLFGIGFELSPLRSLELLGRHAAFVGFGRHLLLHGGDLLRAGFGRPGRRNGHGGERVGERGRERRGKWSRME